MAGQAKAAGETNPVFPASTAVRIIPCLDIAEGRVVKGVKFQNLRDAGDAQQVAQFYSENGADEICFLDITASHKGRKPLIQVLERVAEVFCPAFGGGWCGDSCRYARPALCGSRQGIGE